MPYFRELPFSRIPPYESAPYDLPPVPRPDPYALDQAAVESYPPSFGPLMPPLDPRYLHSVQSRSAPPSQSGRLEGLPDSLLGWFMDDRISSYRRQPGTPVQGVDPKTGLERGGLAPGTDHNHPYPNFKYGSLGEHLLRDPELVRYLGQAREDDIRDLFGEFRRSFMPDRPAPETQQWQKPVGSQDPRRQPQTGPAIKLRGAPTSPAPDSRVVFNGQGGGGPGFGVAGDLGINIGQGRHQVGASVGGSLRNGGKPPKTVATLDDLKLWLETPEGVRATLNRNVRGNGFGLQFGIPF